MGHRRRVREDGQTAIKTAMLNYETTGLRAAPPVLESASPGLACKADRATRREVDRERAERIADDFEAFLEDWYRQPLFASLARHGLVDAMVERRRYDRPDELGRSLRGMGTGAQPPLWERIAALRIPTLALTGARDAKCVGITARMARRNPRIRPVFVPEAGHNVHAERPGRFRDRLCCFIDPR